MSDSADRDGPRARFSAAAATYDARAGVQAAAADRLVVELLAGIPAPRRILEVGCGTGQLTARILGRFPTASVDALDVAPGMVAEARRKIGDRDGLRWIVEDARRFEPGILYDLIVSSATLHWLEPLRESTVHLGGLLEDGGRLAAAIMLDGTLRELHESRLRVAPGKPPLGRMPTPAEILLALEAGGLRPERFEEETAVVSSPSARDLLDHLRLQGLTGGALSRAALPLRRGEILRLIEDYESRHRAQDGVRVTYRIGFLLARRLARDPVTPRVRRESRR